VAKAAPKVGFESWSKGSENSLNGGRVGAKMQSWLSISSSSSSPAALPLLCAASYSGLSLGSERSDFRCQFSLSSMKWASLIEKWWSFQSNSFTFAQNLWSLLSGGWTYSSLHRVVKRK
jgi:hypothetical protein